MKIQRHSSKSKFVKIKFTNDRLFRTLYSMPSVFFLKKKIQKVKEKGKVSELGESTGGGLKEKIF